MVSHEDTDAKNNSEMAYSKCNAGAMKIGNEAHFGQNLD